MLESIKVFKDKIVQSKSIIIVPHHNPDGDAMGSALGLYDTLKSFGKECNVVTPNEFPTFLDWMVGTNDVINFEKSSTKAKTLLNSCDLLIMVDFNCNKRVKSMSDFLEACSAYKIIVDHHPFPDHTSANTIISDTSVSSTCELMFDVLVKAGFKDFMTVDGASCFYAGIMTDTGALSHNSSRPQTYHIVADLVEMGIDKDEIHKKVFHSNSIDRMRLIGYSLLEKMILIEELGAGYISLTKEELERFNFKPGDTEGLVNFPLGVEGINISALFMEQDSKIKVSLRSRGDFAVNELSEEYFNGGGHHNAAGGESTLNMDETINKFVNALKDIGSN